MERVFTIIDDDNIELNVKADYEVSADQYEECHGSHNVGGSVNVDLLSVEVVVKGCGVEIIHLLHKKALNHIEDLVVEQIPLLKLKKVA